MLVPRRLPWTASLAPLVLAACLAPAGGGSPTSTGSGAIDTGGETSVTSLGSTAQPSTRSIADARWAWAGSVDPTTGSPPVAGSHGVAFVGDLTGDGLPDLLVGDDMGVRDGAWTDQDEALLLSSASPNGDIAAAAAASFDYEGDGTGLVTDRSLVTTGLAGAGDVTGDGTADLWIGCIDPDLPGTYGLCLFAGPLAGAHTVDDAVGSVPFTRGADGAPTGVAGALDLDGSPLADVATLADQQLLVYLDPGAAFHGPDDAALVVDGRANDGDRRFSSGSIEDVGDVDGDGVAELALADLRWGTGELFEGAAYLVPSDLRGSFSPEEAATASFLEGGAIGRAGDVNGDGYADLAFQASGAVLLGPVTPADGAAFADRLTPVVTPADGDRAWHLTPAGDVDDDGFDDLVATLDASLVRVPGAAAVAPLDPATAPFLWTADPASELPFDLGRSVSVADFDGDGYLDLATSQTRTGYDASADAFAGGVYVLAGPDW